MAAAPGKDGAVAPQERINIRYRTETGGVQEDVELPLRMLVIGDFTGRPDTSDKPDLRRLEERKPINIDKNNFDDVLRSQQVGLSLQVDNVVKPEDKELKVELRFDSMKDFEPEGIARADSGSARAAGTARGADGTQGAPGAECGIPQEAAGAAR
jgi:type VI secretion system protein ImpB